MTTIKKLRLRGFKSFPKQVEIPFEKDYSVVLGPNGSGKSSSYDTIITLNNGQEIELGKLVGEALENAQETKQLDDGIYCKANGTKILSVNPISMKLETKEVTKFIKRQGETLYHLRTRTGKEVKATGCHPVMVFKEGMLKSILIRDLKEKDLIATPRKIVINTSEDFDKDKARLLGYLIGDGYIAENRIEFVNKDLEIIEDFKRIVQKFWKNALLKERDEKGVKRIYIRNKEHVHEIREFFLKEYRGSITGGIKKIPSKILCAKDEVISEVLAGIFDTDGSVRKDLLIIETCSKNKELIHQVQRALLRFGIISKIKKRSCAATNTKQKVKRDYYFLYIYGYENIKKFYIHVPLRCKHKKENLENGLKQEKVANPNIDILPEEVNTHIKELAELLGLKVKLLRKEYPKLAAYCEDRCLPSREGVKKILLLYQEKLNSILEFMGRLRVDQTTLVEGLEVLNIPGGTASKEIGLNKAIIKRDWATHRWQAKEENLLNFYQFMKNTLMMRLKTIQKGMKILENIAYSDIFWDEIASITKIQEEPFVYDLTIQGNHNFIGNGIFIHNSNLTDAICFVLGELSSKLLRAEKSSNLIYNGGKTKEPAKEAQVDIHFDNKNKVFPTKENEIKITRILKKSGNSIYKINDETRTRQQVLEFLAAAKIDPDGHNIILQGDIVRFMEMKPEQRREIIEEIAGISIYEDKKHKAMQELEKVDAKLNEAEVILKERETNLRELKKERDQAKKFQELKDKIKDNKATYLQIQIKQKQEKQDEIEKRIEEFKKKTESFQQKIKELRNSIQQKREEIKHINQEVEEKGEKDQLLLRKEIENLKTDIIKHKTRIETINAENKKIIERKIQLKNSTQELITQIKELETEKKNLEAKEKTLTLEEQKTLASLEKFKKQHNLSGFSNVNQQLSSLEQQVEEKRKEIMNIQEQKQELLRNQDRLELQLQEIDNILQREEKEKEKFQELKKLKDEFKEIAITLSKSLNEDAAFTAQLKNARLSLLKNNEDLAKLKIQNIGIKETIAGDFAVKRILAMKKGVYGTVGELGKVNSKYALALDIAAGPRIKSIVVDNEITASKYIQLLKEERLGIATFLPLNKIKARNLPKVPETKNIHGLAINLIEFDKKFQNVFSYVFGSTLVVENLETARKVGIGNMRMVTLTGDLVEPSGAMIGGYRKREGAGFTQKELSSDIEKIGQEVERLTSVISLIDKKKEDNEEKMQKLKERKSELEGNIIKFEKSLGIIDDILEVKEKRNALLSEKKEHIAKIKSLETQKEQFSKEIEAFQKSRDSLRKKLESPEVIATLENLEKNRQSIMEEKLKINSSITNIDNKLNLYKNENEKIEKIFRDHDKEKDAFKSELTSIEEILKNKEKELKEKESKEKEFYGKFKYLAGKRNKFLEIIQKEDYLIIQEEEKNKAIEGKMHEISIDRAKIVAEKESLLHEFESYKDGRIRKGVNFDDLKLEIKEFEKMIEKLGSINLRALEVYETLEVEHKNLVDKTEKLKLEKEDVLNMMTEIEQSKKGLFMKTYKEIATNFKTIFNSLTTKGEAYIELENEEDPLSEGVDIKVKITTNKYLDIRSLSGGEKTLAALSFIFAIQEYTPASFYLLDEVDAALDKQNSEKLSQLIAQYSKKAQYIVVSHNDQIISEANQVYGVSMQDGISKVVSLKV